MLQATNSFGVMGYAKKAWPKMKEMMKQLDDSHEKLESEMFKPWLQNVVNKDKKSSWQLLRTILPSGSETCGTHLTVNRNKDAAPLA